MIVSYQNSIVKLFDIETGSEYMKLPSAETYGIYIYIYIP